MQMHEFNFVVNGPPEDVWDVMWRHMRRDVKTDDVAIDIYHPGDEAGNGLVRHCTFKVPKYLFSGGRAQSWEWITGAERPISWRYDAIGKPLWSKATGITRLEAVEGGKTRLHFTETYEAMNPVMRALLEKRVHTFISHDNDRLIEAHVVASLERLEERRRRTA